MRLSTKLTKIGAALVPLFALGLASAQQTRVTPPSTFLDRFSGTELAPSWVVLNPGFATLEVAGGALHVTPAPNTPIWFMDTEGVLVCRPVTGDFTATTRVHARSVANPTQPPALSYRLGGLLARDPNSTSGARDSVHVAIGAGDAATPVSVEEKTTVGSVSVFTLHPIPSADGELRIRRRGASFELAYRASGGLLWTVLATHVRTDLPATLDVGLMAYSATNPPDLRVSFERFTLEP